MYRRLRDVTADEIAGLTVAHPFRGLAGTQGEWDYDCPLLPAEHVTDEVGTGFVTTAPSHGDEDYQVGLKFGLKMTHNVIEDGSFRADLPRFGGKVIVTPKGKDGDANPAVIEALIENGALIARGRLTHSYPHSLALQGAADLPQHAAMVRRHRQARRRRAGHLRHHDPPTRPDLDRRAGRPGPRSTGRNRLHSMIEARPDWVLSPPARLGRAADLLRQEGRQARRPRLPAERRPRSTPASSPPSRPKAPMPGMCKASRSACSATTYDPAGL